MKSNFCFAERNFTGEKEGAFVGKKYTISDIAEICNVSKATVSRVINNKSCGVGEETKRRIQKTMKELNYRPSSLARSVATSCSHMIGLIIPDVSNLFYPSLIRGVSDYLDENGYSLCLSNSDSDPKKEKNHLLSMVDLRVDGVILCSGVSNENFLAQYRKYNVPIVFIGRTFDIHLSDGSITGDNTKGAEMAMKHLLSSGNRRIVYLDGNAGVSGAIQRYEGYRQALMQAGIELDESLVHFGDFTIEFGQTKLEELIRFGVKFDAVFAGSDLIGIGVVKALHAAGKKVPDEIEVIGFDGIELSEIFEPQLSTVRKPHYDMAREATRMLLSIIEGTAGEIRHISVQPTLILRNTTRKKPISN